jgi:hypothetical protein
LKGASPAEIHVELPTENIDQVLQEILRGRPVSNVPVQNFAKQGPVFGDRIAEANPLCSDISRCTLTPIHDTLPSHDIPSFF